jgi:hypothetical protein
MSKRTIFLIGIAAVIGFTALWHGPLGAGQRLSGQAEASARKTLEYYELPMIQAHMQRGPLARRLILSGPADDFQRAELVRILDGTPGVLDVRWDPASLPQERSEGR